MLRTGIAPGRYGALLLDVAGRGTRPFFAFPALGVPALATRTTADIADAVAKLQTLVTMQDTGTPIDVIVVDSNDGSPGRMAMLAAIQAIKKIGDDVEQAARALGLSVTFEKPSETL